MIIKNLSRKATSGSTGQLIGYICRYIANEQKLVDPSTPFLIKHNLHGQSLTDFARQFADNEANRIHKRSDQISVQHTILSWHKNDSQHITNEMLTDIVSKYINLRGDNNMYLWSKHEDKSHIHLHGIVSATRLDGKSSRMSQREFAELKVALQEYQKEHYPQLAHSLPRHGFSKNISLEDVQLQPVKRHYRETQKEALYQLIQHAKQTARSHDEIVEHIKAAGHQPYFNQDGKLQGIAFNGETKYNLPTLGVAPTEMLIEIANSELDQISQLEELRAIRYRTEEKETELHAREFLLDLYQQGYQRDLEMFDEQRLIIEPENESELDVLPEPHDA